VPLSSNGFDYTHVIVNCPQLDIKAKQRHLLAHKLEGCISPRKGFKGSNLGKTSLIPCFLFGCTVFIFTFDFVLSFGQYWGPLPPSLGTFWGTLSQVVVSGPGALFVVLHAPTTLWGHATLRLLLFMVLHTPL